MRTKTLILTAVLGVVGAATASAQVYSVNTVGYVNVNLCPKFNLVANPLDNKTGNNVGNLFGTSLPDGSTIFKYNCPPGSYENSNTYDSTFGGWGDAAQTLAPGVGFWLYLDGGAAKTVTFVGDVMQGTLTTDLCKGFNLVGSKVPQAGALQAALGYTPADGDIIFQWDCTNQKYKDSSSYDSTFGGWSPADPMIAVAEGFWVYKEAASAWTRTFTVQ